MNRQNIIRTVALGFLLYHSCGCSSREQARIPVPSVLKNADIALYCESVATYETNLVYIVREVWKQGTSGSSHYTTGDAVDLFAPMPPAGGHAVLHFAEHDGSYTGGCISVHDGQLSLSFQMSPNELKSMIRESIEQAESTVPVKAVPNAASANETALSELQEHLELTAVPDTRTPQQKLSELDGVIEVQAEKVREAEARLARAQTQREIEHAQEAVRIHEHILNSLKEKTREGIANNEVYLIA